MRSDIAAARKERCIISTADLSAAVEAQSQLLEQALQLEVRQLENQLTSMKRHLALLGKRTIDQVSGAVLHSELRMALAKSGASDVGLQGKSLERMSAMPSQVWTSLLTSRCFTPTFRQSKSSMPSI